MFLPVRKIVAVLLKPAKRARRIPCTMQECMDDVPVHREAHCRPWVIIIIVFMLLYYVYYTHIPKGYSVYTKIGLQSIYSIETDDIENVKKEGKAPCGIGCNFEALSDSVQKTFTHIFMGDSSREKICELNMTGRGRLQINSEKYKANLTRFSQHIELGGYYTPGHCKPQHKIAIIVPYRDREANLNVFLHYIHPFLMNQNIEYRIFVIEQSGQEEFNKGRLLNVGFEQSLRFGTWQCVVFHDVDLLPMDERILYTCPSQPRLMSVTVLGHKNDLEYEHFGGVSSMTEKDFRKVNGYSNMYWGIIGVDSNMFWRIRLMGLRVLRYERNIAVYTALPHPPQTRNYTRSPEWLSLESRRAQTKDDGLSNIRYKVISLRLRTLFTHVLVDLNPVADTVSRTLGAHIKTQK